jgi:hypothetical protein
MNCHLATTLLLVPLAATLSADDRVYAADHAAAGLTKRYVVDRTGKPPNPYVAIKDVTAWPNLTLLPDGTIVAALFNQPSHGRVAGEVECWASSDRGKTWEKRGIPFPHAPDTNRMNHSCGLASSGDLVVIVSGWSDLPLQGQTRMFEGPFRAGVLDPVVCRSSDGGRTWSADHQALPARCPDGGVAIPFGDIAAGADGQLRMVAYGAKGIVGLEPGTEMAYLYRSPDDGRTWTDPVALTAPHLRNETAILHLGQGKWIAVARYHNLALFRSDDDARSWEYGAEVTGTAELPGHLLRLRDGRILLTHGDRTEDRGVEVRFSSDEGVTWSDPLRVVDFQGDGGYPSSVQLDDGQVLTAYYAQAIKGHQGYHMGVVTWDPK